MQSRHSCAICHRIRDPAGNKAWLLGILGILRVNQMLLEMIIARGFDKKALRK